jgi:hypothetical protein
MTTRPFQAVFNTDEIAKFKKQEDEADYQNDFQKILI